MKTFMDESRILTSIFRPLFFDARATVNQHRNDGTRPKEVYHDWVSSFRRTFDGAHLHSSTPRSCQQQDETDYRFENLDNGN